MPFLKAYLQRKNKEDEAQAISEIISDDIETITPKNQKVISQLNIPYDGTSPEVLLNNFWQSHYAIKTKKGFLYERYIGILYEKSGYNVEYNGILKGNNDMGLDLICLKGRQTTVIQCKCLGQTASIHVNMVHQFYGSYWQYVLDHPREIVKGVFYTNTKFMLDATVAGAKLGLRLKGELNFPNKFPVIRCVLKRRLYYLPSDANYFFCGFSLKAGDCYCMTVAEAESKRFRWVND